MTIVQKEWYTVLDCLNNPQNLYVFGDNTIRKGKAGQAVIRDCGNSYGIATKVLPSMNENSFFEDSIEHLEVVENDILGLKKTLLDYDNIIFPADGLGTGLSDMPNKCPKLFTRFNVLLYRYFKFNNPKL